MTASARRRYLRRAIDGMPADLGTPERARQQGGLLTELRAIAEGGTATTRGARARVECVLDAYRHRSIVTDRQFDAGVKLRALAFVGGMLPRTTAQYREPLMADGTSPVVSRIGAADECRSAIQDLAIGIRLPVVRVCILDEWAGNSRQIQHLVDGLDVLAKRWGM